MIQSLLSWSSTVFPNNSASMELLLLTFGQWIQGGRQISEEEAELYNDRPRLGKSYQVSRGTWTLQRGDNYVARPFLSFTRGSDLLVLLLRSNDVFGLLSSSSWVDYNGLVISLRTPFSTFDFSLFNRWVEVIQKSLSD